MPTFRSNSFIVKELPVNLQVVSAEATATGVLVRIGHQFGINEDGNLSKPVDFDVSSLFPEGAQISELTLNGLRPKSTETRFDWLSRTAAKPYKENSHA